MGLRALKGLPIKAPITGPYTKLIFHKYWFSFSLPFLLLGPSCRKALLNCEDWLSEILMLDTKSEEHLGFEALGG